MPTPRTKPTPRPDREEDPDDSVEDLAAYDATGERSFVAAEGEDIPPTTPTTEDPVLFGPATAAQISALWSETPEEEIHFRKALKRDGTPVMKDGAPLMLAYVTARYVQDRLDMTVGAGAWQSKFESLASGAVRCGIGILVALPFQQSKWIWKWDVGTPSSIEPDKGAHSDAFKRAAVQWGVARDLYDERDEREPVQPEPVQAAVVQQPTRSVRAAIYADAPPAQVQPQAVYAQDGQPEWICPIHNDVQIIPAGVSKRTNRPYPAFYGCPVPGCDETGGNIRPVQ